VSSFPSSDLYSRDIPQCMSHRQLTPYAAAACAISHAQSAGFTMKIKAALTAICFAATMAAGAAQAATVTFHASGGGIQMGGQLAYGPDGLAGDPASASSVTGASGWFSDANIGISNWTITGVVATNPTAKAPPIPTSVSYLPASGPAIPALDNGALSYDDLLYLAGSPDVCGDGQQGGFLDVMGLALVIQSPDHRQVDYVDIWSDGGGPIAGNIYGAAVATSAGVGLDYQDNGAGGIAFGVPEPATWSMLILGVAMIGFAARRRNQGTALAA
jgi:hypothetical protein